MEESEIIELPLGSTVNKVDIKRICDLIKTIQINSEQIRKKYFDK